MSNFRLPDQSVAVGAYFKSNDYRCAEVSFGRMRTTKTGTNFDILHVFTENDSPRMEFNLDKLQELKITFRVFTSDGRYNLYSLCHSINEIDGPLIMTDDPDKSAVFIRTTGSFKIFQRKVVPATIVGLDGSLFQTMQKRTTWCRCNEIPLNTAQDETNQSPIRLFSSAALFEVGRCNAFCVKFAFQACEDKNLEKILQRLQGINVKLNRVVSLPYSFVASAAQAYKSVWSVYYNLPKSLSFRSLYLIEAAVTSNRINETDLPRVLACLAKLSPESAIIKILEQIAAGEGELQDPVAQITTMFDRKVWLALSDDHVPEYCVKLQKVVITATSMIILPPSMEMSNRILRQYATHLDRFMRVQFLDDMKRGRLHGQGDVMAGLFKKVMRTFVYGIEAGGRTFRFLAFGNSQLREHGAFFFSDCTGFKDCGVPGCQGLTARQIREDIGDVSAILIVAKQAARVGQAFSTTRALQRRDNNHNIVLIQDFIGGIEDRYCFSEGVGMITNDLLREVSRNMGNAGEMSSAFQFRLGGAKGVLTAISPAGLHARYSSHILRSQQIFLRQSQTKFQSDHDSLEVVRLANYGSAFLNRQFITTLWTLGIEKEVFLRLQNLMIKELNDCMLEEEVALRCLRKHVDEAGASLILSDLVSFGFLKRGDPFVNQVLRLFRSWSLKQLKEKAKISIEKGCYLMGVTDEVGVLRGHYDSMYDQDDSDLATMDLPEIFLQITDTTSTAPFRVIEGVCLVGRAPALHPGDIRLVRAVDKPELRYLRNVLVFPSSGDQDVPSMCGGGDLDGDDYTIIWEPSLIPSAGYRYVRCMNYEGPKPKVVDKITLRDVFEFVIDFMKNDSLGQIAYAHLAFAHDASATIHGKRGQKDCRAFSDECMTLAGLHSTAVDFVKTGIPAIMPTSLYRKSYPDFMEIANKESFVSDTPLSHLYREVKTSTSTYLPVVTYDKTLCDVPNMLEYLDAARQMKKTYDQAVRRLMAQYGIKTEAEVVTGFILGFDAQGTGKREFSMRVDVGHKYSAIKSSIRKQIKDLSSIDPEGKLVDRHLAECTRESFVAAMYDVTFADMLRQEKIEDAMVSFPWVEHEVLGRLSTRRSQKTQGQLNE